MVEISGILGKSEQPQWDELEITIYSLSLQYELTWQAIGFIQQNRNAKHNLLCSLASNHGPSMASNVNFCGRS